MKANGQFLIYKHTIISYHDTVNMCMVGFLRTTVYDKSARVGTIHNIFPYTYIHSSSYCQHTLYYFSKGNTAFK